MESEGEVTSGRPVASQSSLLFCPARQIIHVWNCVYYFYMFCLVLSRKCRCQRGELRKPVTDQTVSLLALVDFFGCPSLPFSLAGGGSEATAAS